MPKNGWRKRAVRRRKEKTGENYTTASRHLAVTARTIQVDLEFRDERYTTALHVHYVGQFRPQPCHVWLNLQTRVARTDYDADVGSPLLPGAVWRGVIRRIPIPSLAAADANKLLKEIQPLLEQVVGGAVFEHDHDQNLFAYIDDNADDALWEIEEIAAGYPEIAVIPAEEVVLSAPEESITADTTDAELDRLAQSLRQWVSESHEGRGYVDDLDDYLRNLRDEAVRA
jgi:hypothetical protein